MKRWFNFLREDSGAVSVDFVVLCAGVVAMAMLIIPTLAEPVGNMAEYVGDTVTEYGEFLEH
jgi:Flp pilus assembly pilin Flp